MKSVMAAVALMTVFGGALCFPGDAALTEAKAMADAAGEEVINLYNHIIAHDDIEKEPVLHTKGHHAHHHGHKKEKDRREANILVRYFVPPDQVEGFLKAFEKQKDSVVKEDGNIMYKLFKPLDDNVSIHLFGKWKSHEDYMDHLESRRQWAT